MLRVLSTVDAASSSAEDVAVLLDTHCTAGLTDEQVILQCWRNYLYMIVMIV